MDDMITEADESSYLAWKLKDIQVMYQAFTADLQSSLTLANSCSSEFTLRTMAYVSILVPFVLAYIIYAWRAIDRKPITAKELEQDGHAY